jgi:virginiamycin B lyase
MSWIRGAVLLAAFAILTILAAAQTLSNPYQEIENWLRLPEGRMWGAVYGVGFDSHGNIWTLERCGGSTCIDSKLAPILEFDSSGKFLKGIGQGLFAFPHGLFVDKEDNLWVADAGASKGIGNQVTKLSPDGKVLLTLGKKGVLGGGPDNFVGVSDMLVAPNGDIFVADGHAAAPSGGGEFYGFDQNRNNDPAMHMRIAKFSKEGKFIKSWGKLGTGPGEFNTPHSLAMDSRGRLFVADRGNNRIQIFDQDGKFLEEWRQFGKPVGIFVDTNDSLYAIDSDSNADLWSWKYSVENPCATCLFRVPRLTDVGLESPNFTQGVRIGSVRDGIVRAFIPPRMGPDGEGPTTLPERVAADAAGNVYLAEARTYNLRKYVKKLDLPEGAGKEIVKKACALCHDFSEFTRANFDREDWDATVNMMVAGGAPLKKEEIPVVVDYLATHFKGVTTSGIVVPGRTQATITEWDLPTSNSYPTGIYRSPRSGFTWYTGEFSNVLGRFDLKTEQFQEYHLRPGTNPSSLAEYPRAQFLGTIFFTSQPGGLIGEFHPTAGQSMYWRAGDVFEHSIPDPKILLHDIAVAEKGPGVVWFTVADAKPPLYQDGSKIGSFHVTSTEIRLVDTPTPNAEPYGLVIDSNGVPYFAERNGPRLGSVDPVTMKVTEYLLPNPESRATGITVTPDDVVWYTDTARGYLGRFDPKTGKFDEWTSPSGPRSRPWGITNIGNIIWYAEAGTKPNMLVRFDLKTEEFQSWPVKAGGGIRHIFADADGSLWFTRPLANGIAHVTIKEE